MNLKIIKENDKELEILAEKEKATIFMLLKEELDKDPDVIMCAWKEDHPLSKNIHFYIKTNGKKSPKETLMEYVNKLIKKLEDFEKVYNKALHGKNK
ncbi:hypothetical protein BA065_01045 [Nanoarchaeota archaeon NZ13-N]|uniref:DNA-directed RNA polymerase subunit Rpo11 n=1 Tax=Candidatus Nanoclepta minutus TaxID=1940235 RepID=A0A397WN86_9ARCH|nr:MAG: hypothetical protein BA065_01045 [Nanoarchaeota archaeon NZ13-N]RIB35518.1 MAG: hypothetical protein BXU00_00195 [Candidatus Nanoclepta minutus]